MRTGRSLTLLPAFRTLSLLLDCFVHLQYDNFCLFLLYFILSHFAVVPYKQACSSQMRDRKGVDLKGQGGEKELVGVEGGETIVKIHYMRRSR